MGDKWRGGVVGWDGVEWGIGVGWGEGRWEWGGG